MEIITPPSFFLPEWISCTINVDVVVMPSFPLPFLSFQLLVHPPGFCTRTRTYIFVVARVSVRLLRRLFRPVTAHGGRFNASRVHNIGP